MKASAALVALAAIFLLLASCFCCCTWPSELNWNWEPFLDPGIIIDEDPTPQATVEIITDPLPEEAGETEELLKNTVVPVRDQHELAIRLRDLPPDTPRTINPEGSPDYPVGTRRLFHVSNTDTDEQFDIYAILEYKTEHVYMWIEEGSRFDPDDVAAAAELFEEHTYVTNRAFFGSEWTPGVDNDPHISILNTHDLGYGTLGYFSGPDECVSPVRPDSNEMEMFYINLDWAEINSDEYNGVLAHEFQHMIHWHNDRNEQTWLNEGFSDLASYLNGFGSGMHEYAFARNPDNQLNDIDYDAEDSIASYGAGYLFTSYFLGRFGSEATQSLASHEENGLRSVDEVLGELGTPLTHEELFADWVVANLLDDPDFAGGRFGYQEIDPPEFQLDARFTGSDYPLSRETTARQYGTDYIEMTGSRPLRFSFSGSTLVGLLNTDAHSGQYLWWSNREDDSDVTLTRAFDLTAVDSATLKFWTWYDLEENWDYAYVETSTDGGQTWDILATPSGTLSNPNGNSFGWAYTSASGGEEPRWIQEEVDLSPYAGRNILIRFEYITDDAVNRPGFAIDDVAIPEVGYFSDFEADGDGWEAAGFMRHANTLPQRWLLQLILYGDETTVQPLELDPDQTGEWVVPLGSHIDRAVMAVSAMAPVTTELAPYRYQIDEQ